MHEAVLCIESTVKGRGTEREKNKQARKEGHKEEREGERGELCSASLSYIQTDI